MTLYHIVRKFHGTQIKFLRFFAYLKIFGSHTVFKNALSIPKHESTLPTSAGSLSQAVLIEGVKVADNVIISNCHSLDQLYSLVKLYQYIDVINIVAILMKA